MNQFSLYLVKELKTGMYARQRNNWLPEHTANRAYAWRTESRGQACRMADTMNRLHGGIWQVEEWQCRRVEVAHER